MDPDTFFKDCDAAIGGKVEKEDLSTQKNEDTSLELMDIFSLMDGGSSPKSSLEEEVLPIEVDTYVESVNELENLPGVTLKNTPIRIKAQSSCAISEYASIKDIVVAYFEKYGVSLPTEDFSNYVNEAFTKAFPYNRSYTDVWEKLQCILILAQGVGLTVEALKTLGFYNKIRYANLRLSKRLVGSEEVQVLQECSEEELDFIRKYSLSPKATMYVLGLYRRLGIDALEVLKPYLNNVNGLELYAELSQQEKFDEKTYQTAMATNSTEAYRKALQENDEVCLALIKSGIYDKTKDALCDGNKEQLTQYTDYYYLETIVGLLDSGFTNTEIIDAYLKEKNEIGDYLAKSNDMNMLKLLNKGYDVYYAILSKIYNLARLKVEPTTFVQHKDDFTSLVMGFVKGHFTQEDVLLHTVFILTRNDEKIDTSLTIREAIYKFIMKDLVIIKSGVSEQNMTAPEVYQLISGKSSYVFNVYDFCNHFEEVMHAITMFTNKRKNVRVHYSTSEICIITFGNDGGINFINSDRQYGSSLKNWCTGNYDKTRIYSMDELLKLNGLTVLRNYTQGFEVNQSEIEATDKWIEELYASNSSFKADLVMDYILRNPKSLALLLNPSRQAGIAALSRVLELTGFNQAFYFLMFLAKGLTGKDPVRSIQTQRQPTHSEIIIKSKYNGNKICTFDTIFTENNFNLLMRELKNAKTVKITYVNSIVLECEEE